MDTSTDINKLLICCLCGKPLLTQGFNVQHVHVSCDLQCNKTNAHIECLNKLEKGQKLICPFCKVWVCSQ